MYAILPCLAERVVFLSRVPDLGVLRLGLCLGDLEDARGDFGFLEVDMHRLLVLLEKPRHTTLKKGEML